MTYFDDAFTLLMEHEGGAKIDSTSSMPSKFGIELDHWHNLVPFVNMTEQDARGFYLENYWTPLKLDKFVSYKLATILFDLAVNQGSSTAVKHIQALLNLRADGVIGPTTLKEINAANPTKLALKLIALSADHYVQIARSDPKKLIYLAGWVARTYLLVEYLFGF